ncbi:MAG: hypothetical protein EPN20_05530 [Magnetospirillum sp.]|nr:MAG: hypothetical protein EPN20_05530 [Magnetospirillum sp.]
MSKVVALAEALGVTVEWLSTGRGPKRLGEAPGFTVPAAPNSLDEELLDRIATGVAEVYREENARIYPLQLVQLAGRWYADLVAACPDPGERPGGLKAMLQQLRRELRSPQGSGADNSKRLA